MTIHQSLGCLAFDGECTHLSNESSSPTFSDRTRLTAELGDDYWRRAVEAGAGRTPEKAFADLIDRLAD